MRDPAPIEKLREHATMLRRHVLAAAATHDTHVGGSMSAADLMAALYFWFLRLSEDAPARDHFILSKGHCATILHACMVERGAIDAGEMATAGEPGSRLAGHPSRKAPGVEFATGSLGHGLGVGVGVALGERLNGTGAKTVVLLGDGELQEGTVWEAALVAPQFGLTDLLAIVDYNRFQAWNHVDRVVTMDPMADKWRAFRWNVKEIDGHDMEQITGALAQFATDGGPTAIVANTIKGKSVPGLEATEAAHFITLNESQLAASLNQLGVRS